MILTPSDKPSQSSIVASFSALLDYLRITDLLVTKESHFPGSMLSISDVLLYLRTFPLFTQNAWPISRNWWLWNVA